MTDRIKKTAFELVSPERLLLSREVEMVVIPGADGDMGVLARHAPVISTLRPGVIEVYEDRPEVSERIFVAGGFVEVTPSRCTVLAEDAARVGDLRLDAIDALIRNLREDVADAKTEAEKAASQKALATAEARRDAARRYAAG